jgi:hypothetical protein
MTSFASPTAPLPETVSHEPHSHEPDVQELLDDPIAQLLMQTDGVQRAHLDPLLQEIMQRIDAAQTSQAAS